MLPVPELLVAKALAMTQHIILGTGVTLLSIHHPVEVAHRIAMLDHLARGRYYSGIGARALPTDLQLFGFDPTQGQETRERSREALEVILGSLERRRRLYPRGQVFPGACSSNATGAGTGALHETLPASPPSHRGGPQHSRLTEHSTGWGKGVDSHEQLQPAAQIPPRPVGYD